jgi:hypothetical protein
LRLLAIQLFVLLRAPPFFSPPWLGNVHALSKHRKAIYGFKTKLKISFLDFANGDSANVASFEKAQLEQHTNPLLSAADPSAGPKVITG